MIITRYYPSVMISQKVHHEPAPSRYFREHRRLSALAVSESAKVFLQRAGESPRCLFCCRFALHLPPEAPKVFQESIRKKERKKRQKNRWETQVGAFDKCSPTSQ